MRREAASSGQDFIAHKMETDDLRSIHRFVEVTLDGVFDHRAQLIQGFPWVWMPYPSAEAA